MFQNIADMGSEQESINNKTNDIKYRLKEIFKYQNVIIYILTLLLSTLTIKNQIMPFGLAMVAACVGETVPIIGVFLMALIGTAISMQKSAVSNFIVTSIIYFILVLFFKAKVAVEERNEVVKTGGKLFAACMIVSIIKCFTGMFLLYDVFMSIISSSIVYVFYKLFVNGLAFIKDFNIKKAFTMEELIAGVLIISLASLSLKDINIFSLNLSNIIIIFMIMVLGWKNGMVTGAVSGISIGLAISFVDGTSLVQISMFAISGILSGLLNRFGKIGVILGFILGNAILTYFVRGASTMIIYFREIFIASIGLLLVPNKIKLELEDLIGKNKLISNTGDNRLEESNDEVSEKLKTISDMFNELFSNVDKENAVEQESFVQDFLDNLEEVKNNIFYDEISNEENGIAKDICTTLKEKDILLDNDLINILKEHNNYVIMKDENIKNDLQEIVKIANRTLKIFEINKAKKQERKNNMATISQNLKNVTKVIDKCAEEIKVKKENIYENKEKELGLLLKSKKIKINNVRIKKLKNEKFIVELKLDYYDERLKEKEVIVNIADIISKSLGTRIVFQRERKNDEKKEYYQMYSSEDKFVLQVGSAKITKDGSEISGDCSLQIKLADGKYLLAIADGMGSGEKARECSKIALRLVKQMLSAGFNKDESIKMINSRLNLAGNSEIYSSLDISILDLYVGKVELLKNGACSTYIKNKKNIRKIDSTSMPVGIVNNIELQSNTIDIIDGDIIIMCSDGVLEAKDDTKREWIEDFLKNVSTNNVQKLADLILAEAVDNSFGIAQDDMTVIVSKIVKKK
ncbi:MAG TPA: SpoIIE family protein phosphatase [Candidatus Scatovivens faecipullorum]|nr:SpoIIE family protein phosphatase [Candidatus Scatovivens faecipullorum]